MVLTRSFLLLLVLAIAPRAQEPTTPKKTRLEKQKEGLSQQKNAINALKTLLVDIRQLDDLGERVTLAESLVSLLAKEQPEECRALLNSLLDDCIRLREDKVDDEKSKRDPDTLARKLIQIGATVDQKLAKSLLERYSNRSERESATNQSDVSRTRFFLNLAYGLVDKDPSLAASTAANVLSGPVIPETLLFLNKLRDKNPPLANALFSVGLAGIQSRGGRDPNELLLMFSYTFLSQRVPIITTQGLGTYSLPGYTPPVNYSPESTLAGQYLETTVQLLLDPARYSRENLSPTLGAVGDWFLVKFIEPKASLYRADLSNSLIAQQQVLEGRLQTQQTEAAASFERWNNLPNQSQNTASGETIDNLLKRADQPVNSKRRDQLLYRAAMAAVRNAEYDRALEIVGKISADNQNAAKQFVIFDIALAALRKQDTDRAARLAEKDDDLLRRAYVFTLVAKSLVERKDQDVRQARLFLSAVETLLPKLDTDKDRVSALIGLSLVYFRFDGSEASRSLKDLIKYANRVDGFAGDASVSRMLDVGGFYFDYSLYDDFSFEDLLNKLGRRDFNGTLEDVRQLESRAARFKAIVATCTGVLSAKRTTLPVNDSLVTVH